MKKPLLFAIAFVSVLILSAQNNDWYLFNKASQINKILPDDVNNNEIHLATDMGYIKYNTSTNSVTNFLNLTSQNPAIGHVRDIALNPTNNDIALTLENGIAIYDGNTITTYYYGNSGLTIGESTSPFYYLKVEYAKDGSLYIYKEDAFGYQKFNNGVFDVETTTTFKPQDIIENNAGTKAYFAGANNGLWELEKASTIWTNYTTSNSNLFQNFLTSFAVDSNDNLFIGNYQGLDRLEPNGTFSNCNATSPIAVFEISLNSTNNDLLVNNSKPNSANIEGISTVDFDTCTWTNYKEDGANCLDHNVFSATAFGNDGNVYAAKNAFPAPKQTLTKFNTTNMSCSNVNVNYLNSPEKLDSSVITDIDVINPADSVLIGMTKGERLIILAQHKNNAFNGTFGSVSEITPSSGKNAYSLFGANEKFVVENNDGWVIIDGDKNTTEYNHGIPNYQAIVSKKATISSSNGDLTIIHKGFDESYNYHVFKTPCNTTTGIFGTTEELFTIDTDLSKDIKFGAYEDPTTGLIYCLGVKTNASGGINREMINWTKQTNGTIGVSYDEPHSGFPLLDPEIIKSTQSDKIISVFVQDIINVAARTSSEYVSRSFDTNNDGQPDNILYANTTEITELGTIDIADFLVFWLSRAKSETTDLTMHRLFSTTLDVGGKSVKNSAGNIIEMTEAPVVSLENNLPADFSIRKSIFKQYNNTDAIVVLLTNYGILIKKGVDISPLTLSSNKFQLNSNKVFIYPNPANNQVSFSDKSIKKVEIFDINGRKVLSNTDHSISIKNLSNGIYIIKGITNNNQSILKKLIKN